MTNLPTRIEQADESQQRELLEKVLAFAKEQDWIDLQQYYSALHYTLVGAFVDAVLMLVPEGCQGAYDPHFMDETDVVRYKGYIMRPDWSKWTPYGDWFERTAGPLCSTPALAIAAAALRARGDEGEDGHG